ncbi:THAP domain-containing protein 9 [Aphis craccivora]|uniref:THAP domain-containing protein 9 n=1 Tax=Aphis craccivora TaxID=307492 RepID=A0A6G0Y191_APHCR|nr:THAP domain-containing protein 9 [Aphis craccivora]
MMMNVKCYLTVLVNTKTSLQTGLKKNLVYSRSTPVCSVAEFLLIQGLRVCSFHSLKTLDIKTKNTNHSIYCTLVMYEMAIRQHLEYDGTNYYRYIDLGNGLSSDSLEIAKECLWFSQKSELVQHALSLLYDTGIKIISLTFDVCSSNTTVARLLGCNLNSHKGHIRPRAYDQTSILSVKKDSF